MYASSPYFVKLNFGHSCVQLLHSSMSMLFLYREAYPTCQVCAVTLGYDVAKLMYLDKER